MRVVIAPDSFKEACPAMSAARAMARGWQQVRPADDVVLVPMADGGEGTVAAVAAAWGIPLVHAEVTGPLGDTVVAAYAYDPARGLAVIEMAEASGLHLVAPEHRNPAHTTTRGTGELMAHAVARGARKIIVGVGGSATNDGGTGALRALALRLLDDDGNELPEGGAALASLARVDCAMQLPALRDVELLLACDVSNPLCGPEGASAIYGPQKGASPQQVAELDAALARFAHITCDTLGIDYATTPGAGAAGGLAFGLMAYAGAKIQPGVSLVAEAVGLEDAVKGADLVLTGEGRIDAQTLRGKTPYGVAQLARRHGVPMIALAGQLGPGHEQLLTHGFLRLQCINEPGTPLPLAIAQTEENLTRTALMLAREVDLFVEVARPQT